MAQILLGGSIGVQGTQSVLGNVTVNYATDANLTLTAVQWANLFLEVTSGVSLTTTRQLIAPLNQGQEFIVQNNTTGGQSITIIGSSGTGVTITNGQTLSVACDGTNYLTTSGPSFAAGGDLSGTAADQTVIGIQTNPVYAQVLGSSEDGYALIWNADGYWLATQLSGGTTTTGTGLWYNSSGTLNPAAITLAGDVSEGALSGGHVPLTVVGLDGIPIVITTLTTGNQLLYNGTDWINSALNLAGGSGYVAGTLPAGNLPVATTGALGIVQLAGDIGGTDTSVSVLNIHGASVPIAGSLTTGNVLQVSGSSALTYAAVNLAGGANYVTGTLPSGNLPVATTGALGIVQLAGDIGGTDTSVSVLNVHGASVPAAGSLTTGNVLQVSGASALSYAALNLAGGAGYITGNLPIGNVAPGTSAQVLLSNATPASTWTTISGDSTISATGAMDNVSAQNGNILFNSTSISFINSLTNPSFFQANKTTNSGTGNSLTIQAQNETGTTSTGGDLILSSGSGTSQDGYVWLQCGGVSVLQLEAAVSTDDGYVSSGQIVRFDGRESVFANNTTAPIYAFSNNIVTTDGYSHTAITVTLPTNTNSRWTVSAIARDQSNGNDFGVDLAIFQARNVSGVLALNPTSPAMVNMIPSSGYGSCALSVEVVGTQIIVQVTGYGAAETLDWNVFAQVASIT